jgi:hypothetical protein
VRDAAFGPGSPRTPPPWRSRRGIPALAGTKDQRQELRPSQSSPAARANGRNDVGKIRSATVRRGTSGEELSGVGFTPTLRTKESRRAPCSFRSAHDLDRMVRSVTSKHDAARLDRTAAIPDRDGRVGRRMKDARINWRRLVSYRELRSDLGLSFPRVIHPTTSRYNSPHSPASRGRETSAIETFQVGDLPPELPLWT